MNAMYPYWKHSTKGGHPRNFSFSSQVGTRIVEMPQFQIVSAAATGLHAVLNLMKPDWAPSGSDVLKISKKQLHETSK